MSTVLRDLWPADIKADDVLTPEEILTHQAEELEKRTNGILVGHVVKFTGEDRVVLGFEVESPRLDTTARLFEVQHRLKLEYPATIIPPTEQLPDYLKDRVYHPGSRSIREIIAPSPEGKWIENQWVGSTPVEFSQRVETVLARPEVKSIVISLLARSSRDSASQDKNGDEPEQPADSER